MDKRKVAAVLLTAAAAMTASACGATKDDDGGGGGAGSGGGSLRVGAMFLDAQGFYGGVRAGFEDAAKRAGVKLKLQSKNAASDASAENSFLNTLVSSKVDAIVVSAVSETASVPAIRQAANAGIPVVCYNTCVGKDAIQKYVFAYALGDPVKFGALLGDAAGKYFKGKGVTAPKIAVINCEFVEVCKLRRQGFVKALKAQVPGAKIVANQRGETLDKAVPIASDMTTDLAKALEDNAILKADVDISGKVMGAEAFKLVQDAKGDHKPAEKVVPVRIDLYDTPEQGAKWLETHADGLP
jgi:sugar transport system substrate-binding protein